MKRSIFLILITLMAAIMPVAAADFKIDNSHTSAVFRIEHFGIAKVYGRFNDVSGSFNLDKAIDITIKTGSIDTNNQKRDDHLRSPDFFNANQFPTLTFKSTKIEAAGKDRYKVTGDISIHGVTKSITVEVHKSGEGKDPWGNYRKGLEVEFTIKRSDFGMTYMADGIGDDVEILFATEGIKQ
jgi:polyisoprenoid-binding protein YceI